MNRAQFLHSLNQKLEDLPSSERNHIISTYAAYLESAVQSGKAERDVIAQLGSTASCAAKARDGILPSPIPPAASSRPRSGNPFEPQMAAQPGRKKAPVPSRQKPPQHAEEPGKKPWAIIIVVTLAALVCIAFAILRYLSSDGILGYASYERIFDLSEISDIIVEDQNRKIIVKPLTTSDVRVNYYEGHHEQYAFSLANGVLHIQSSSNRTWYDSLLALYDQTDPVLTLYLPPDFSGSLTLTTENQSIEASGLTAVETIQLQTSNAPITLSDIHAIGAISATTSNSAIWLSNLQTEADLRAATSNGTLSLTNGACQSLSMVTSNGLIEFSELSSTISSMQFITSNASIIGSIYGEEDAFRIQASTTNSRCNLTNSSNGDRSLQAETTNGTINVTFIP